MAKRRVLVGNAHFFVTSLATARAIHDGLKSKRWRDVGHDERERKIYIKSEIGEIGIAQYDEGPNCAACALCGESTWGSSYMLKDSVWAKAGLGPDDLAHAVCVAVALGRLLTAADFTMAVVNDLAFAIAPPQPRRRAKQSKKK